MRYIYVGKNIEITDSLKSYLEDKLSCIENYSDKEKNIKVSMSVTKQSQRVEVSLNIDGVTIYVQESSDDMYKSIDLVTIKLKRKVIKEKSKFQKKGCEGIKHNAFALSVDKVEKDSYKIDKQKSKYCKPMSDEEAVLQLNASQQKFLMFVDLDNIPSVVYRRNSGEYGIIQIS